MDSLFQVAKTRSHLLLLIKCQDSNEIIGYYSSLPYKDKVNEGLHILYCIHTKTLDIDEYIIFKIIKQFFSLIFNCKSCRNELWTKDVCNIQEPDVHVWFRRCRQCCIDNNTQYE